MNTAICERVAVLDDTVRAAIHEPQATEVHQRSQRLRREGYQVLVHRCSLRVVDKGALRTGEPLSTREASMVGAELIE
ncbi:MAG: hypothetical protein ABI083_04805 [Lapillicoccus sp.]